MTRFIVYISLLTIFPIVKAQKVGLVLSGGGAKGMAHIGVIRALEENNIPIDYITGTSIGSIIGGLYAIGYSPDEMEALFRSKEMQSWYSGEIPEEYIFYFKKPALTPSLFSVKFSRQDSVLSPTVPSHLIKSGPMDYAFLELFTGANVACQGDFDELFVPYRAIASDIFNKKPVILSKGNIGDAIRASMTFPLYFKPIRINGQLLFDGGIYNNFPKDVMTNDFEPDIIIGSKVADDPKDADEDDALGLLSNMIMEKTDYSIPEETGFLIETLSPDTKLLDFQKVDRLSPEGYESAMAQMDKIKAKIHRRKDSLTLANERAAFKRKIPESKFNQIQFSGLKPNQLYFVSQSVFKKQREIDVHFLKKMYYKLMAEPSITSIRPSLSYNTKREEYFISADFQTKDHYAFELGGNISSLGQVQGYFGGSYHTLGAQAVNILGNVHFGPLYTSALASFRLDYPTAVPFYLDFEFTYNQWYYNSPQYNNFSYSTLSNKWNKRESFVDITGGLPISQNSKFEAGILLGRATDRYPKEPGIAPELGNPKSKYYLAQVFAKLERNTQNYKNYAVSGTFKSLTISYKTLREQVFEEGSETEDQLHSYWTIKEQLEQVININKSFKLSLFNELQITNQPLMNSYHSTLAFSNAFQPNTFTRTFFLEDLHASNYIAPGIKPIWDITQKKKLYMMLEMYYFLPYEAFKRDSNNQISKGEAFKDGFTFGSSSLVWQTKFGPVSISLDYYPKTYDKLFFHFNFGYLIFNKTLNNL